MGRRFTAKQMAEAIEKEGGNLSAAARRLGCTRRTVHNYVNKYVTVEEAYHEARDKDIDVAESQLQAKVKEGHWGAIKFTLATRGRYRGYVERKELTGADGDALEINVTVDDAS